MARSTVRWALTAGHCGNPAAATTWSTAGTQIGTLSTVNAIDAGAVDAAAIQVTDPGYAADTVGRIYIDGGANAWVGVKGWADTLSFIWVGDTVCVSARYQAPGTFGNPCGVVTNTSDPTNRGLARYEGYDPCSGPLCQDRVRHLRRQRGRRILAPVIRQPVRVRAAQP